MKARAVWVPGTDRYDLYMWEETPTGNAVASFITDNEGHTHIGYTLPEPGSTIKPLMTLYGRELRGMLEALQSNDVTKEIANVAPDLEWIKEALDQKQADYSRVLHLVELAWSAQFSPRISAEPPPPTPLKGVPNGNE